VRPSLFRDQPLSPGKISHFDPWDGMTTEAGVGSGARYEATA